MENGKINWTGNMARWAVIGGRKNISILQEADFSKYGLRVEIMQYDKLIGDTNIYGAQSIWFMQQQNIKCRQIAIYILHSGVKIEAGAMSYFQGPMQMTTGINSVRKAVSQYFNSKMTKERFAMPEYKGDGILVLEPSFKHFYITELEPGESIICDKGLFYAASLSVNVQPVFAGTASGSLLGGEGIFQQQITGPGMLILELPVPQDEITMVHLENDVLRVDGNFAIMRTAGVQMLVEKSSATLVGSAVSGEGLVNVFRGTGDVWIAPSLKIYDAIHLARAIGGNVAAVDMNTSTGNSRIN